MSRVSVSAARRDFRLNVVTIGRKPLVVHRCVVIWGRRGPLPRRGMWSRTPGVCRDGKGIGAAARFDRSRQAVGGCRRSRFAGTCRVPTLVEMQRTRADCLHFILFFLWRAFMLQVVPVSATLKSGSSRGGKQLAFCLVSATFLVSATKRGTRNA